MAPKGQNYLVHIEFNPATNDRLLRVGPRIVEALQQLAGKDQEMVWRSLDRSVIAYVVHTPKNARQIHSRLTQPGDAWGLQGGGYDASRFDKDPAVLGPQDKVAIISIGAEHAVTGYGRLAGWINGHQS